MNSPAFSLGVAVRGRTHRLTAGERLSGEVGDSYRDAPAQEVRAIIAEIESGTPWRDAVAARFARQHPWLHRIVTDPARDLYFRQHPPAPGTRALDIGAGWGQIALPLARTAQVCALEPTPERLEFIHAAARQEGIDGRMWFVQSDFLETSFAERFDLIICIGVLEWVPKFAPALAPIEAQRKFLRRTRDTLAPGGTLVIGIENRLGLKYLLGAPDDHLGVPGIALHDADLAAELWRRRTGGSLPALTHSRAEYEALLREAGYTTIAFWSAFPDYKVPQAIIAAGRATDEFLAGRVIAEHDGIRGEPLPFQESLDSHYRSLARLGIATDFAPSFFITARPE